MMAKMTRKPARVDRSAVSGGFFSWASGNRSLGPEIEKTAGEEGQQVDQDG
jgi:hypothetical protein